MKLSLSFFYKQINYYYCSRSFNLYNNLFKFHVVLFLHMYVDKIKITAKISNICNFYLDYFIKLLNLMIFYKNRDNFLVLTFQSTVSAAIVSLVLEPSATQHILDKESSEANRLVSTSLILYKIFFVPMTVY